MIVRGGAASTPSVESIVPSPFWSIPRPPAGIVTAESPRRRTVSVPSGAPPWPTTVIAIVARAYDAIDAAPAIRAPFLFSGEPGPKIETRPTPRGAGAARRGFVFFIWWRIFRGARGHARRREAARRHDTVPPLHFLQRFAQFLPIPLEGAVLGVVEAPAVAESAEVRGRLDATAGRVTH